jgi:hypothetical protein
VISSFRRFSDRGRWPNLGARELNVLYAITKVTNPAARNLGQYHLSPSLDESLRRFILVLLVLPACLGHLPTKSKTSKSISAYQ